MEAGIQRHLNNPSALIANGQIPATKSRKIKLNFLSLIFWVLESQCFTLLSLWEMLRRKLNLARFWVPTIADRTASSLCLFQKLISPFFHEMKNYLASVQLDFFFMPEVSPVYFKPSCAAVCKSQRLNVCCAEYFCIFSLQDLPISIILASWSNLSLQR